MFLGQHSSGSTAAAAGLGWPSSLLLQSFDSELGNSKEVEEGELASLAAGIAKLSGLQHFHLNLTGSGQRDPFEEGLTLLGAGHAEFPAPVRRPATLTQR